MESKVRKETRNWLDMVDYDLITARQMFKTGRYVYVIFMCHLAIEKALKAIVCEETNKIPPKTHDLIYLINLGRVELAGDLLDFIGIINNAGVVTRYPEDLSKLVLSYPEEVTKKYLNRTFGGNKVHKAGQQVKEIVEEYKQTLKTLGINVERVILYGSYALGNQRQDSDIDLVIISKDFKNLNLRERLELLGIAAVRIMEPVEARGYTPEEIERTLEASFLKEVLKEGVSV